MKIHQCGDYPCPSLAFPLWRSSAVARNMSRMNHEGIRLGQHGPRILASPTNHSKSEGRVDYSMGMLRSFTFPF